MKPVQERLHIDELKRVEKQTNTLLKAWRTLNKNYRQLQEDYDKLNIRHNLTVQEHQETPLPTRRRIPGRIGTSRPTLAQSLRR